VLAGLRHSCYANFVHGLEGRWVKEVEADENGFPMYYDEWVGPDVPEALSNLAFCLAFVDLLTAAASTSSVAHPGMASQAACGAADATLQTKGHGRATRLTGFHVGHGQLHISCTNVSGGLAITVSTASNAPLSSLVGPELKLAVMRSKSDSVGGRLSFSYHRN
jgi:hypothetical protein